MLVRAPASDLIIMLLNQELLALGNHRYGPQKLYCCARSSLVQDKLFYVSRLGFGGKGRKSLLQ